MNLIKWKLTNGNELRLIIQMNNVINNGYELRLVMQNKIITFNYTKWIMLIFKVNCYQQISTFTFN